MEDSTHNGSECGFFCPEYARKYEKKEEMDIIWFTFYAIITTNQFFTHNILVISISNSVEDLDPDAMNLEGNPRSGSGSTSISFPGSGSK